MLTKVCELGLGYLWGMNNPGTSEVEARTRFRRVKFHH